MQPCNRGDDEVTTWANRRCWQNNTQAARPLFPFSWHDTDNFATLSSKLLLNSFRNIGTVAKGGYIIYRNQLSAVNTSVVSQFNDALLLITRITGFLLSEQNRQNRQIYFIQKLQEMFKIKTPSL